MPITDRVTLFGYSAAEVEKSLEKFRAEYEEQKTKLESNINELETQIGELKQQIEKEKENKTVVVKKRYIKKEESGGKEQAEIMDALYKAHMEATEKILKVQKNISVVLEKKKSLILIRERKANEMKKDLQNLIDYIDQIAKSY